MSNGYISIPNWDKFQHYKDRQPAWIKLHLELLGNDSFLDLSAPDKVLLIGVWMLVGRYGNCRVRAESGWLNSQLNNHKGSLERLKDAGFIEIVASKALAERPKNDSAEKEGSKEPLRERNARANSAAVNGAVAHSKKELEAAIAQARGWLDDDGEPPHLVEHTVRQAWPDMADAIIATLAKDTD